MASDSLQLFNGQRLSIKTIERKAKLFERLLAKHGLDGVRVDNTNSTSGIQYLGPGIWIVTKKMKDLSGDRRWQRRWSVRVDLDEIPSSLSPSSVWTNKHPVCECEKFYQSLVHNGILERYNGIIDTSSSQQISQDDRIKVHYLALEWFLNLAGCGYSIDLVDDLDEYVGLDTEVKTILAPWTSEEKLEILLELEGRSRPADDQKEKKEQ